MIKTRILVTGDRSNAETGFAVYKRHLLKALHECPDFEVAELGYAGHHSMKKEFPWRFYPSNVNREDAGYEQFISSPENKYGAWRWNELLLHFKPHLVISPIDPWQTNFQIFSPLKPYYHLCLSPPIDSGPISDKCVALLTQADSLVAYIDYGRKQMEARGLTVNGVIPMGVSTEIFYELPKRELLRHKYGVPEDKLVFGFVARNQKRKRIPELLAAFRTYLDKYGDNAVLYLHTTYPDLDSWNIPRYLIEFNLLDHVYFTYRCRKTRRCFARKFSDRHAHSPVTSSVTAKILDVNFETPTAEELNEIYNLFDVYVQCVNSGGQENPIVEAAATNARVVTIDHAAMSDTGRLVGAILCPPKALQEEKTVETMRAVIDIELLADKMHEGAQLGRTTNGNDLARQFFDWKTCCTDLWISYVRSLNLKDVWNSPKREFRFNKLKEKMDISDAITHMSTPFHDFGYNVLKEIEHQYHGGTFTHNEYKPADRNEIYPRYKETLSFYNHIETVRCGEKLMEEQEWMI